jgi:hypothetical protein
MFEAYIVICCVLTIMFVRIDLKLQKLAEVFDKTEEN